MKKVRSVFYDLGFTSYEARALTQLADLYRKAIELAPTKKDRQYIESFEFTAWTPDLLKIYIKEFKQTKKASKK